jgi:hypothetical protein
MISNFLAFSFYEKIGESELIVAASWDKSRDTLLYSFSVDDDGIRKVRGLSEIPVGSEYVSKLSKVGKDFYGIGWRGLKFKIQNLVLG